MMELTSNGSSESIHSNEALLAEGQVSQALGQCFRMCGNAHKVLMLVCLFIHMQVFRRLMEGMYIFPPLSPQALVKTVPKELIKIRKWIGFTVLIVMLFAVLSIFPFFQLNARNYLDPDF